MKEILYKQDVIEALICADENIGKNTCIGIIKRLPSAQPDVTDINVGDMVYRQDAIDAIGEKPFAGAADEYDYEQGLQNQWERDVVAIKILPPAQPERKKGKWIKLDMHAHLADHKCTACGQECYVPTCMGEPMYTYCPNCGADMRGEEE